MKEALELLKELSEILPEWYSDCNCYSVGKMKEYEIKIDRYLDAYYASQPSNAADDLYDCPVCDDRILKLGHCHNPSCPDRRRRS